MKLNFVSLKWRDQLNKQLRILFIGTYVPKKCGIATFTSDLLNSVSGGNNGIH